MPKVEAELAAISATLKKDAGFAAYLKNPTIPRETKAVKMLSLLGEDKFSNSTRNLFQTLAGNGRLGQTEKVIDAFNQIMEASRGVVRAVVITAEPLSAANVKTVQAAVGNLVETGGKVSSAFMYLCECFILVLAVTVVV